MDDAVEGRTSAVSDIGMHDIVEGPGSVRLLQFAGADCEHLVAVGCRLDADPVRYIALEAAPEAVGLQLRSLSWPPTW
jgi:hypothetical protein